MQDPGHRAPSNQCYLAGGQSIEGTWRYGRRGLGRPGEFGGLFDKTGEQDREEYGECSSAPSEEGEKGN